MEWYLNNLGGPRIAVRQGSTLTCLHADALGSASLATSLTGTLVSQLRYLPYGTTRWSSGPFPTDRRYTGQRAEVTLGLYDYGARFYSPSLGRFAQADTIVPEAGNPQALNRYSYVNNDPVKWVDSSGHCWGFASGIRGIPGYAITCNNLDMALTIVQSPDTSWSEKALAGSYIAAEGAAHAALVVGAAGLACGALSPAGCGAAAESITAAACVDGNCTNETQTVLEAAPQVTDKIVGTEWTVLGRFSRPPGFEGPFTSYVDLGRRLGARIFEVPTEEWNSLTAAQQWARNVQFLDESIARGDSFRLSYSFVEGMRESGTFFHKELIYLLQQGYEYGIDVNGAEWLYKP